MTRDERADQLAVIASQLAGRVRDEGPEDVAAWLMKVAPTHQDVFELCFVLAAALPVDKPFLELTSWTSGRQRNTDVGRVKVLANADWIRQMRDRGMTSDEVADTLGCTITAVNRVLKQVAA